MTQQPREVFPFGQPLLPRPPSAREPRPVFVLGAYPSGFHVAWWLPEHVERRLPDAKALIVDNEPEVLWDGTGAANVLESWRRDVRFEERSWGRANLAEPQYNGPSGAWFKVNIMEPLEITRADCWITDCLDTARQNANQRHRIETTYLPQVGRLGLPVPALPSVPSGEGGIINEARNGHLERLARELATASPDLIVTLGNAALRVMRALVEIRSSDPGVALTEASYGSEVEARLGTRSVRWLPLIHPRPGERVPRWRDIHLRWVERKL